MDLDPRTDDGVAHVARLARLALTPDESQAMKGHMQRILAWVAELDALDTAGVPATLHDGAVSALRADEVTPSLAREQALANAPRHDGAGFEVPAVLSE